MLKKELDERIAEVECERLSAAEHIVSSDSRHVVHLHHIGHTSALFRKSDDRRNGSVLEELCLYLKLVLAEYLLKELGKSLLDFFDLFLGALGLERIADVGIDAKERELVVVLLDLLDEGLIDVVSKDDSVESLGLKHVDVLALLLLVGNVVDLVLLGFLVLFGLVIRNNLALDSLDTVLTLGRSVLCLVFNREALLLDVLTERQVLAV